MRESHTLVYFDIYDGLGHIKMFAGAAAAVAIDILG